MSGEQWEILPGLWVRVAPESRGQVGHHQHSDREKQKAQERGMVKSTMAQLFHGTVPRHGGSWRGVRGNVPSDSRFFSSVLFSFFNNEKTLMCFLHNYIIGFNNNNNKELKGEKRPQNTDLGVIDTHRSQVKPRNLLCCYHCWEEKSRKSKDTEGRKRRPQGGRPSSPR